MRDAAVRSILQTASLEGAWRVPGDVDAWLVDCDPRWPVPFVIVRTPSGRRCGIVLPDGQRYVLHAMPDRKGVSHALRFCAEPSFAMAFPDGADARVTESVEHDGRRWGSADVRAEALSLVVEDVIDAQGPPPDSFVDDEVEWMLTADTVGGTFPLLPRASQRRLVFACDWLSRQAHFLRIARGHARMGEVGVADVTVALSALCACELTDGDVAPALAYFGMAEDDVATSATVDLGAMGRLTWLADACKNDARALRLARSSLR